MKIRVQVPNNPGAVVYVCNPSTGEAKTGFLGLASSLDESPSSRFSETQNKVKTAGIVIDTFNPSTLEGRAIWISVNSSLARAEK